MSFRGCHCHHDAVRFYRNAVNAVAVIMQILMADPQGCATLTLGCLTLSALLADLPIGVIIYPISRLFSLHRRFFNSVFLFFLLFLRVLSQTVEEPKNNRLHAV
jgi:hypothetical protein